MTMRKFFMGLMSAVCALGLSAQGVEFMPEGSLLKDALAKAKAENKDVLLDCYTTWCGPCRMMSTQVFPQKVMGDYINPRFVSIKIDMEKGEGPELARQNDVAAYPTFIIFSADGKEKGRMVGGSQPETFLAELEKTLAMAAKGDMNERYAQGERSQEFLMEYLEYLNKTYRKGQLAEVADALLDSRAETFAADSDLVDVFMKYSTNPYSTAFTYTVKHPDALKAAVGEIKYNTKVDQVFSQASGKTVLRNKDGGGTLDSEALDKLCAHAKDLGLDSEKYRFNANMSYLQLNKDWGGFVEAIKGFVATNNDKMPDMRLSALASRIEMSSQDAQTRAEMKAVIDRRLAEIKSGKRAVHTSRNDPDGSGMIKQLEEVSAKLGAAQ